MENMRSSLIQTTAQLRAKVGGGVARSNASNISDLTLKDLTIHVATARASAGEYQSLENGAEGSAT